MRVQPDHGEDSYRGHGRLAGKAAVVTGGDYATTKGAIANFTAGLASAGSGPTASRPVRSGRR
jgi:hypothetical protein